MFHYITSKEAGFLMKWSKLNSWPTRYISVVIIDLMRYSLIFVHYLFVNNALTCIFSVTFLCLRKNRKFDNLIKTEYERNIRSKSEQVIPLQVNTLNRYDVYRGCRDTCSCVEKQKRLTMPTLPYKSCSALIR